MRSILANRFEIVSDFLEFFRFILGIGNRWADIVFTNYFRW